MVVINGVRLRVWGKGKIHFSYTGIFFGTVWVLCTCIKTNKKPFLSAQKMMESCQKDTEATLKVSHWPNLEQFWGQNNEYNKLYSTE